MTFATTVLQAVELLYWGRMALEKADSVGGFSMISCNASVGRRSHTVICFVASVIVRCLARVHGSPGKYSLKLQFFILFCSLLVQLLPMLLASATLSTADVFMTYSSLLPSKLACRLVLMAF